MHKEKDKIDETSCDEDFEKQLEALATEFIENIATENANINENNS